MTPPAALVEQSFGLRERGVHIAKHSFRKFQQMAAPTRSRPTRRVVSIQQPQSRFAVSSSRIRALTADWERCSCLAASVKLSQRATSVKARSLP